MQQLTVNSKEVIDWLKARNKLRKDWGYKLKALHLQSKKVVEYLKTLGLSGVNSVIDESQFQE